MEVLEGNLFPTSLIAIRVSALLMGDCRMLSCFSDILLKCFDMKAFSYLSCMSCTSFVVERWSWKSDSNCSVFLFMSLRANVTNLSLQIDDSIDCFDCAKVSLPLYSLASFMWSLIDEIVFVIDSWIISVSLSLEPSSRPLRQDGSLLFKMFYCSIYFKWHTTLHWILIYGVLDFFNQHLDVDNKLWIIVCHTWVVKV